MFTRHITRRPEPLAWGCFPLFGAALLLSLGISALMLEVQGKPGLEGIRLLLEGGFGHVWSLEDTLLKTIPIFLCAAGVAVCFRMQIWNIGAEGQFVMGAIGAAGVVLAFPQAPAWALLPGMALGAAALGALWAFIPALLRCKFAMNEIISSLMLNYVAVCILNRLLHDAWKDPSGSGMPVTFLFPEAARVPELFGRIHWGLACCLAVGPGLALFFKHTRLGFEIRAAGENPRAALYAGMPYAFLTAFVLCLCGALAGLAGGLETSALVGRLQTSAPAGYGYTAIVVAWLARLRVGRIALFAFFLAGIRVGVENLQVELSIPAAFGSMIEGCILLIMLAGQFFETYRFESVVPTCRPTGGGAA